MVIIYSTSWCPSCVSAKRLLDSKKIGYKEINIEQEDISREKLAEIAGRAKQGREILDTSDSEAVHSDHSGDVIFLDPRHSIKMPYNSKAKTIKPKVGTTLVHPAYLWHETETHTKPGIRVAIVINFNIENPNYDLLPTYLI